MPPNDLRLLALDGGGVRGLSSLMILRSLMAAVDPDDPPKPCDYFDMIGGTSTGGLIAVMLGRLRMTVDECIVAYTTLSDRVFEKKSHRVNLKGRVQGRFDSAELERAIKDIIVSRGLGEDALLKDTDSPCKVFVCAVSKETGDTVCLASYRSPRSDNSDLLNSTTIWQACRATSAATSFFDPIAVGPFQEEFVDGALGENNPVYRLWNQAQDLWGGQLRSSLKCLVSVGTGVPALNPLPDDVLGVWATVKGIVTETEKTAQRFHRDKSDLDDDGRYYRFNVDRGLEEIGLEESRKKKEIAAATRRYLDSQAVFKQVKACANSIAGRQYLGPYRTPFSLQRVPVSANFVARPSITKELEGCLLPRRRSPDIQRRVLVLHGLGGIGKTQLAANFARRHQAAFSSVFWLDGRSEDQLKQSVASCAGRIPEVQMAERSRTADLHSEQDLDIVVTDVLDWLARPDNTEWLLIFDNVDKDPDHDGETGAYDIQRYLPGDHGSVLVTTTLSRLAQLGESRKVNKADDELGQAILEQWSGRKMDLNEDARRLLTLLGGLPLALAHAGSYLRETEVDVSTYVRLYDQQWDDLMESDSESGSPLVDYKQGSIGTTWTISLKAVEARNKNAANLLRLWAFLDNKDVWFGLLHSAVARNKDWPQWLVDVACDEAKFLDAARLLLRYSMIESQESEPGSYIMHPVVHRWTAHIQNSREKREHIPLAVTVVGLSAPARMTKGYWVFGRRLLGHMGSCSYWIQRLRGDDRSMPMAFFLAIHMLGQLYRIHGRLEEAESMYRRALQGQEKTVGLEDRSTLRTVNALGTVYRDQGQLERAEALYTRVLWCKEKLLGPDHSSTLAAVNNLGLLYVDLGRLDQAEALLTRALQGQEKTLGLNDISTLGTVNALGSLCKKQGQLERAGALYTRGLRGTEKILGPDHPSTLKTVHTLGAFFAYQGRVEQAEALFTRALGGREKVLGVHHPSTVNTVISLGDLYLDHGRLEQAEALLTRALGGEGKIFGPDHPSTLHVVYNLGLLYKKQGRLEEAEVMSRRARSGFQKAEGPPDPRREHSLEMLHSPKDQPAMDNLSPPSRRTFLGKLRAMVRKER